MLGYEDLARMIENKEVAILEMATTQSPLWVHTNFSERLLTWTRDKWEAFIYDKEWGLLLLCERLPGQMRAIVYREVDTTTAAILVQYLMAEPVGTLYLLSLLNDNDQVAGMGINQPDPHLVHGNTRISFPPDGGRAN